MSYVSIFSAYYINFTNLSLTFLLYLCFLPLNVQKAYTYIIVYAF